MHLIPNQLLALMVALLAMAPCANAYEEVEDLVDIVVTSKQFVAVVDGRRNFRINRRSDETLVWQGAQGEVGAILTSQRLLAISVKSGQWNSRFLKVNEKKSAPEMLLAAHLVVMLTGEWVVAFGTDTGGFIQARLPIGESVRHRTATGRVAAVATADRVFGFSSYRRGIAELRFRRQEVVTAITSTYNRVALRTSLRLIHFNAEEAVWRELDLQ